jgi:Spy/CpxP family protein refolding chaperone
MKKNRMTYLTLAVMLTLCGTLAAAQGSAAGRGRHPGGPDPFMRCINQLNLSTETRTKVDELIQTEREATKDERDTMKAAMDAYYAALTSSEQDSVALAEAQQEIIALEEEHRENRFALESSIVALLTTDEAAQLGQCLTSVPEPPVDHSNIDNEKESN